MARGACVGVVNGTADDGGGLLGVDVGDTDVDVEGAMGTGGGSTPSPSAGAAASVDAVLAVAAPAAARFAYCCPVGSTALLLIFPGAPPASLLLSCWC